MNEQQAKALFMAQYLGQQIEYRNIVGPTSDTLSCETIHNCEIELYSFGALSLLLRSTDQLTDYEVVTVATIIFGDRINYIQKLLSREGVVNLFVNDWNIRGDKMLAIFDYLRSIGILIPFTYINENKEPVTLTTAQIIAKGWAKIK